MADELTGAIAGREFLDLTGLNTPDELAEITELRGIEIIAVPDRLAGALNRIPMHEIELVVPIPAGVRPKFHQGMTTLGGAALAQPGAEKEFILSLGALVFTTPVTESRIAGIASVGLVAAPTGSENALGAAVTQSLGAVHYFPYVEGQQIKTFAGQPNLGGTALANETGTPDDIMIVAGQLVVNGAVNKLGFRQIVVAGQAILPRDSQEVIGEALQAHGQVVWYVGSDVRLIFGNESYGPGFFELVEDPLALVVFGELRIEPGVAATVLRDKIAGIALFGTIKAPPAAIPALQYRTTEKFGEIKAVEDASE
jgi:hypothetical protein